MTVSLDTSLAEVLSISNNNNVSAPFSPAAGTTLYAVITTNRPSAGGSLVASVSGGALTWASIASISASTGGTSAEVYRAFCATAPGSMTVTVVPNAAANAAGWEVRCNVVQVTGDEGATYTGKTNTSFSASGLPSVVLTGVSSGSNVLVACADWANLAVATLPAGQISIYDVVDSEYTSHKWKLTSNTSSSGNVTMNATAPTGQQFQMAAIEIKSAGGTQFTQSVSGTVGFTGADNTLTKKTHSLATLSFTGVRTAITRKIQSATLSFTTARNEVLRKTMTAAVSFTTAMPLLTRSNRTASLSFTGSQTKRIVKSALTAAVSFTGSMTTAAVHHYTQALNATLSFTGAQINGIKKLSTATVSFVGSNIKRVQNRQSSSVNFTGNQSRRISKIQTGNISFTGTINSRLTKVLSATISFTGNMTSAAVHHYTQALNATIGFTTSFTTAVVHFFTQSLSATLSFTGNQTKKTLKLLSATISFTGSLSRRVGHALSAMLAFSGAAARSVHSGLSASVGFVGALNRRITKSLPNATLSFTVSFVGSAAHFFTQALSATLSFTGNLTSRRIIVRLLTATVSFATLSSKKTKHVLSSTISFIGSMNNRIPVVFSAVLSFTANLGIIPHIISGLSNLRIRVFGRETNENISGIEDEGPISGEEPGT